MTHIFTVPPRPPAGSSPQLIHEARWKRADQRLSPLPAGFPIPAAGLSLPA
jgi:hypothetical protein